MCILGNAYTSDGWDRSAVRCSVYLLRHLEELQQAGTTPGIALAHTVQRGSILSLSLVQQLVITSASLRKN